MGAKILRTASQVIAAIGGNAAARDLTGCSPQQLWNWKDTGRLPPTTYLYLHATLAELGIAADPAIWGMSRKPLSKSVPARAPARAR